MKKTFEEKVKSMSAKEIILAMVDGLKDPITDEVNMSDFGSVRNGVCFGCAATNTICKIGGYTKEDLINNSYVSMTSIRYVLERKTINRVKLTGSAFAMGFEKAIDYLRMGQIYRYNNKARQHGFAVIEEFANVRPISSIYTIKDLEEYIKLANLQK